MSNNTVKLLNINSVCIICITKLFNMRFNEAVVKGLELCEHEVVGLNSDKGHR